MDGKSGIFGRNRITLIFGELYVFLGGHTWHFLGYVFLGGLQQTFLGFRLCIFPDVHLQHIVLFWVRTSRHAYCFVTKLFDVFA